MTKSGKLAFYRVKKVEFRSILYVPITEQIPDIKLAPHYQHNRKQERQLVLVVENES